MIWPLIKLLASGAAERLLRGLSAAWKWIISDWRNGPLVVCALMWAVHALLIVPDLRSDWRKTAALLEMEQNAHLGTISNFVDASAQAKREAEANVARVTAEQEAITDEATRDLRSELAAVTARFDRLRARDAARLAAGNPNPAYLPGPGNAPGGIAGAPGAENLGAAGELTLCPPGFVCLTIDQAQRASEDAHRHDRLIDWVLDQSAVRFDPEQSKALGQ